MTTVDWREKKLAPVFEDPDNFPGISLWQPWAGLIWLAGMGFWSKDLETRPKRIHYRGKLVVSAALRVEPEAFADARRRLVGGGMVPAELFDRMCGKEACGKALALFEVADCRPMTEADHERAFTDLGPGPHKVEGKFVWEGGEIAALDPFKVTGAQGYFRVSRATAVSAIRHRTTSKERADARAKLDAERATTKCLCGQYFPTHLAEFMDNDERCAHICRCHRKYVVRDMKFVEARHGS